MELHVGAYGAETDHIVDLEELANLAEDVANLETMIIVDVAKWALPEGVEFNIITPLWIRDENGEDLNVSDDDWITKAAKFAWYMQHDRDSWTDKEIIYAWVEFNGWGYFDFDTINDWQDYYSQEYDGDAEEFGIEWMREVGEGLPDHLERYFDFEQYGEDLLDGYNKAEWDGRTFLFHQN